jgi:hypothetical protein
MPDIYPRIADSWFQSFLLLLISVNLLELVEKIILKKRVKLPENRPS